MRGLLCSACNNGIGFLGDDRHRLARAIAYLAKPGFKGWQLTYPPDLTA